MTPDEPPPRTERELLELADELLEQAAEIKRQWAELARAVGGAVPRAERAERAGRGERPTEAADPRRLVAVEMMLAGRGRDEVEAHLSREFGHDAARAIVAEVYGDA